MAARLLDMGRSLCEFAERGRIVPELDDPEIRERFVYNYRLIYKISGDTVTIAAVVHAKRQLLTALGGSDAD